jgi:hypothetical protein
MNGPEGLIISPCVAPAVELNRGQYAGASRDRMALAERVYLGASSRSVMSNIL